MKTIIFAALILAPLVALAQAAAQTAVPPNLYICAALVAGGIAFHFVTKLSELEAQGQIVTPWAYWQRNPYTSLVVVMAAYLFMGLQHHLGELSYSAALLTGIACNSIGDKLRARAATKA